MLLALLLLSLFTLVLLGFYVFVAAPRSRAHQTFAAFVACLALWTVKDIVLWGFQGGERLAGWWASVSFAIALLLQYSLVVFAWVFPENGRVPLRRAAVLFAPGVVIIPAALAGLLWERVAFEGGSLHVKLTPLAYAFGLYVYGVFAYGFALLYKKYRRYRGSLWGHQLGAILWALVVTATLEDARQRRAPARGRLHAAPRRLDLRAARRRHLRLRDHELQALLAAIGARPVPPLPHRLQGRARHRGGRRHELRPAASPGRLVELHRTKRPTPGSATSSSASSRRSCRT